MSTYYNYYLGYKTTDCKVHTYGPYDKYNNLQPILSKSRSFASNMHDDFVKILKVDMGEDFLNDFKEDVYYDELGCFYYLSIDSLPEIDYIKSGYFLLDEVLAFLDDEEVYFTDSFGIEEYSLRLANAIHNDDYDTIEYLKKFVMFSYPDYNSPEYESKVLKYAISYIGPFYEGSMEDNIKQAGEELKEIGIILKIC